MNRMTMKKHSNASPVAFVFTIHLEGLWPHKIKLQFSMVQPSAEFQGPLQFIVMALGHSVKQPLL